MYFPLFVGVLFLSLFWYALLCALSSFAIILKRKRELVALLLLPYGCIDTGNVLWLFLTVPWVGLQCVIVVFLIIPTYFLLQCNCLPTSIFVYPKIQKVNLYFIQDFKFD